MFHFQRLLVPPLTAILFLFSHTDPVALLCCRARCGEGLMHVLFLCACACSVPYHTSTCSLFDVQSTSSVTHDSCGVFIFCSCVVSSSFLTQPKYPALPACLTAFCVVWTLNSFWLHLYYPLVFEVLFISAISATGWCAEAWFMFSLFLWIAFGSSLPNIHTLHAVTSTCHICPLLRCRALFFLRC